MTKVCTHGREGALAMQMLEQSLQRLQTDHLDLWQKYDADIGREQHHYPPPSVLPA